MQSQPDNFSLISRLDKVRDRLERQIDDLTRKTTILAMQEPARTAELARVYMSRPAFLTCWAYRELLAGASPQARNAVHDVVTREISGFLPLGGQSAEVRAKAELDLRLRGITLLQAMGDPLTADMADLLKSNDAVIEERKLFFFPPCTWEEVLDVV